MTSEGNESQSLEFCYKHFGELQSRDALSVCEHGWGAENERERRTESRIVNMISVMKLIDNNLYTL